VIYGGVSQNPQTKHLGIGVDILVATPGRLLDLINQRFVKLNNVKYFVLDEADHMLDMGMIEDVRKIIKYIPALRQTMFFSATMPKEIEKLANDLLKDPVKVEITPVSSTAERIKQEVYFVNKRKKIICNKLEYMLFLLQNKVTNFKAKELIDVLPENKKELHLIKVSLTHVIKETFSLLFIAYKKEKLYKKV